MSGEFYRENGISILSVLMLLIFMIHGIMGSFMLNGVGSSAGKLLAWIGVGILVVHTVIGVILTVQSLQTAEAIREKCI